MQTYPSYITGHAFLPKFSWNSRNLNLHGKYKTADFQPFISSCLTQCSWPNNDQCFELQDGTFYWLVDLVSSWDRLITRLPGTHFQHISNVVR